MTPAAAGPSYNWYVVQQRQAVGQLPSGTFADGMEITAQIAGHSDQFTVWVPMTSYNVDSVTDALSAAYQNYVGVAELRGS